MRRIAATALAVLLSTAAAAAAAEPPQTGFEQRQGSSWTTHAEEVSFLQAVDEGSPRARVTVAGSTAQGRPLHLVELGSPRPAGRRRALKRPTVLVTCTQHGNEPAGREACLRQLRDFAFSHEAGIPELLSRVTFLFIPTANPDGRNANTRENADGTDINRDHLALDVPESRAMAAVVRDWQPDVALDLHEYGPSMPVIYDDSVLWLWPRNLNTDKGIRDLAIELGRRYLEPAANEAGYGTDEYGQYEVVDNDFLQTAGDGDEGIMRNAMGLRHALGILVETRVDADARNDAGELISNAAVQLRRVNSHMAVLDGLTSFMAERGADAMRASEASRRSKTREGAERSAPVFFGGADNQEPTPAQVADPPPGCYALAQPMVDRLGPRLALHGIRLRKAPGGSLVALGQAAEPVIPLLLDVRGTRHVVEGTPLDACPQR